MANDCAASIERAKYLEKISLASKPIYEGLWKSLLETRGVSACITVREDTLGLAKSEPQAYECLRLQSECLRRIIEPWFRNCQLLKFEKVSWESTTADVLEKLVLQEKVHKVRTWISLKQRLASNRRVFIWKHLLMPDQPLVALYVALEGDIPTNMPQILRQQERDWNTQPTVATFYSISSMVPGLQGIQLGQNLIRNAVKTLRDEFVSLKLFCTLSPMPGFRAWLLNSLSRKDVQDLLNKTVPLTAWIEMKHEINDDSPFESNFDILKSALSIIESQEHYSNQLFLSLETPLMVLAAHYLARERHRGRALDSVAHFHLNNGASIQKIHYGADLTEAGRTRSFGIMVTYMYDDARMDQNKDSYRTHQTILLSKNVQNMLY